MSASKSLTLGSIFGSFVRLIVGTWRKFVTGRVYRSRFRVEHGMLVRDWRETVRITD